MPFSLAQQFISLGMPAPLAKEFSSQLSTGLMNWKRLQWLSMVPQLAKYLEDSITTGTYSSRRAMELGLIEAEAELTRQNAFTSQAIALFGRFTTPPTTDRKIAISALTGALVQSGIWAKLDALYVLAAADEQAARQNWIANQYNLTATSSPAFTADRGFQGNGTSSILESGAADNALTNYKQNTAHLGIWSRTNLANGGSNSDDAGANLSRITRLAAGGTAVRSNTSASFTNPAWTYPGHIMWSRTGSNAWKSYKNGATAASATDASVALDGAQIVFLKFSGGGFGVNQLAASHFGAGLSDENVLALYTALNSYLVSVGAA